MKRFIMAAIAFLLAIRFVNAQQESPAFKVSSRLVVVDVNVVDKKGNPVSDLQKDDFRLYESGVQQAITAFDPPSTHQVPADISINKIQGMVDVQKFMPNAPVTVLVMDEMNTEYMDMAYVRETIKKYLKLQPARLLQPTAVVAASDSTFSEVHDYTLNRQDLLDALEKHHAAYPFELARMGNSDERKVISLAKTIAALQQIALATGGHKGRKNLIWIGKGFPSIDLRNEPHRQVQLITGLAERTVNLLRDNQVAIYTIDPTTASEGAGLSSSMDQYDSSFTAEVHLAKDPFDGTVSFNTFAPETGGRSFSLVNDIDKQIDASVKDGNYFYSLSYVPSASFAAEQKYKQINVRVDRSDVAVRSMQGYYAVVPPKPAVSAKQEKKNVAFYLGTASISKMAFTGINFVINPSKDKPNSYQVHVNTADMTWNLANSGEERSQLMMAVVALDDKNRPVASVVHEATALLPVERPLSSVPFVPMDIEAKVPQNAVRLRFVVRDSASGQMGSVDLAIKNK